MAETLKVLVVDDDEVDRISVRRALKTANLSVDLCEAWDYKSAIAALENTLFDCVFVDYQLPDRDGLMLVQHLRQQGMKVPLVVLTGQGDEQIAVELMKAGATDYLPKSKVSPEALARIVRNAVRIYRAEQEAELAKQQREQLARQREDFVYRLTHDLRTPLVAADRMLALFAEEAFGPISADMHTAIATMIRSNQNLLQMVNTILEVYRHDAGQKVLSFDACNLTTIIQDVVQELMPLAKEKGLAIEVDYSYFTNAPQAVPCVSGDRLELHRVLINLLGNAIKFTDQGKVTIRLKSTRQSASQSHPSHITLEVQDTGSGIALTDQHHLFERFRQGENKRSGSGLGLYLSRRIIEAHQGTISVQSSPGEGSLFTICIPVQPEA